MRPNLVISDESQERVRLLQEGLAGCEEVTVLKQRPDEIIRQEGLDAVYLSVMGAERWGALPIPHKVQVLQTTSRDAEKGYPPYVIAGGLFEMEDSREPSFQLRVIMNAALDAVETFNAKNNGVIRKIGFWTEWLGIQNMNPMEAGEIIKSVYQEHYPVAAF